AADEARAVEYHHERFDGRGYYGIEPKNIPLAAHFLIVADSYDAMRSDRPYRRGLPKEQALGEIEANAGSQFHPAVAKAFVALERGADPLAELSPGEQADLRRLSARQGLKRRLAAASLLGQPDLFAVGAVAAALFLAGFREFPFAAAALAAGVCAVAWRRVQMLRGARLAARLERALM